VVDVLYHSFTAERERVGAPGHVGLDILGYLSKDWHLGHLGLD